MVRSLKTEGVDHETAEKLLFECLCRREHFRPESVNQSCFTPAAVFSYIGIDHCGGGF